MSLTVCLNEKEADTTEVILDNSVANSVFDSVLNTLVMKDTGAEPATARRAGGGEGLDKLGGNDTLIVYLHGNAATRGSKYRIKLYR